MPPTRLTRLARRHGPDHPAGRAGPPEGHGLGGECRRPRCRPAPGLPEGRRHRRLQQRIINPGKDLVVCVAARKLRIPIARIGMALSRRLP